MAYAVEVPRKVQKQAARLPGNIRDRIDFAVLALADDPRPQGCRKLSGREEWRIRVGSHRIVYEIHDESARIVVLEIWHRQRDYR